MSEEKHFCAICGRESTVLAYKIMDMETGRVAHVYSCPSSKCEAETTLKIRAQLERGNAKDGQTRPKHSILVDSIRNIPSLMPLAVGRTVGEYPQVREREETEQAPVYANTSQAKQPVSGEYEVYRGRKEREEEGE